MSGVRHSESLLAANIEREAAVGAGVASLFSRC